MYIIHCLYITTIFFLHITYWNLFFIQTKHLALDKQLDELPWRAAEARSIDKSLLSNKDEGVARERDAQGGSSNQHLSDNLNF